MKKVFTLFLLLTKFISYSQNNPPGLIYSCENFINGKSSYDIFNSNGEKIVNHSVDWAYSNTWSWLFVIDNNTKFSRVYNYLGQYLNIDSIQESQSTYLNINRVALKRNGKWGYYDSNGKLVVKHLYDQVSHYKNNIAAVKFGNDIFMIDTNGIKVNKTYNPNDKDYIFDDFDIDLGMGGEFSYPNFKKIKENGKCGLLDVKNNKIVVPIEYENLVDIKDNFKLITGQKDGKYGLIAFGGRVVIPVVYKSVFVLNNYF